MSLVGAVALAALAYLWATLPSPWRSDQPDRVWTGALMNLTRGVGARAGAEIVIQDTDPSGVAIVSLEMPAFRAIDYRRVVWQVQGSGPEISAALVWRNDYRPGAIHTMQLGPLRPDRFAGWLAGDEDWIGKITGLALVIKGKPSKPLRVRAVTVSPHTAGQALREALSSWWNFVPWQGAAVNSVEANPPALPMPAFAAAVALTAAALYLGVAWLRRWRRQFSVLALIFACSWVMLDIRWQTQLLAQTYDSMASFAGKSLEERHLAAEDSPVFAFAQAARRVLPAEPSRIIVTAEDSALRGRLAYYLLPHQVVYDTRSGAMPAPAQLKPGDFIVALYRRSLQYSPAEGRLKWDSFDSVPVELLLLSQGNAVFRIK